MLAILDRAILILAVIGIGLFLISCTTDMPQDEVDYIVRNL